MSTTSSGFTTFALVLFVAAAIGIAALSHSRALDRAAIPSPATMRSMDYTSTNVNNEEEATLAGVPWLL